MKSSLRPAFTLALALAAAPLVGCQTGEDAVESARPDASASSPVPAPPQPPGGGGPPGFGGPPGGGPPGGFGGPATGIKAVMRKVAAGPNSLTNKLGNQLKADSPDWATIQAETKDYADAAKEMGTYDPPKGSKESWKELTDAFAQHAAEMDTAARAKDKAAAVLARDQLATSCKACHNAHQPPRGPGGPGGFGPPPGGGPPGPPPGGSGPPPGGEQLK